MTTSQTPPPHSDQANSPQGQQGYKDAKAQAKAQAEAAEAQAEAEAAAKMKTLSPREARKYILPPVKFDKPPFDGIDVTEQVVKSRAEIRKRCPDVKFEPGSDLASATFCVFTPPQGR